MSRSPRLSLAAALWPLVAVVACVPSEVPAPETADASPLEDAPATEARPPATGLFEVEGCRGETGVDEGCTLVADASACTSAPCARLVVIFSGGEMGCRSGEGYGRVLAGYADRGYAAVCINYFETPEGAGTAPYVDEAARIDRAVREATSGAWARAYWTGDDLLVEGISHGATAPVILMARTDFDAQPHWRGRRVTGGCFFDGAYDQAATAALLATGAVGRRACTFPVSHARWLARYCGAGATAASCDLAIVPKAVEDSIAAVAPDRFAIGHFRMFECGSALPACSGDIVAGPPIAALCANLEAAPSHTCVFTGLPEDGHLRCHADQFARCAEWFEALPLAVGEE